MTSSARAASCAAASAWSCAAKYPVPMKVKCCRPWWRQRASSASAVRTYRERTP